MRMIVRLWQRNMEKPEMWVKPMTRARVTGGIAKPKTNQTFNLTNMTEPPQGMDPRHSKAWVGGGGLEGGTWSRRR